MTENDVLDALKALATEVAEVKADVKQVLARSAQIDRAMTMAYAASVLACLAAVVAVLL